MSRLLMVLVLLPALAAIPCYFLGKKSKGLCYAVLVTATALELALSLPLWIAPQEYELEVFRFIGLQLRLRADGFQALYASVASLMWLMTSLLVPQYFEHGEHRPRYGLFTLLTMSATIGVFLSDDLITAFLFFEIMSFTSYCWVIHEETPAAMRAGQTYLAIAVLGGMAMLMGLLLLQARLGTLSYDAMPEAAKALETGQLYLPGALILAGFGAKAGMFPLHVWLPKAHPVAPAPASALLSGVLTKVGVFGILVISSRLFFGDLLWGNILLVLGLINMFLGALLALFSVDLKRTLACSSMSQIGFILVGIGMQGLLGEHNALAAQGTVLHMVNHSLIKLVLFMAAGIIYANVHHLNLNQTRGYGRGRPGLMLCFLVGAASISGIPFFSGYASKTLLHESIVEYIVHLEHLHLPNTWYVAAEWVFIVTGGITLCYMLKLFISLFIEKNPEKQADYDRRGASMKPLSAIALGGSALILFLLGLYPEGILTRVANAALPFLHAHEPEHAVTYLASVNLVGGAKSLAIGLLLYVTVVRLWLIKKDAQGIPRYVNRWPDWLDLENSVYRPFVAGIVRLGSSIAGSLNLQLDSVLFPLIGRAGMGLARFLGSFPDKLLRLMIHKAFSPLPEQEEDNLH